MGCCQHTPVQGGQQGSAEDRCCQASTGTSIGSWGSVAQHPQGWESPGASWVLPAQTPGSPGKPIPWK